MKEILKQFPNLTENQIIQFQKMEVLYYDWNAKINVISRKDIEQLYLKHILHSRPHEFYLRRNWHNWFLAPYLRFPPQATRQIRRRLALRLCLLFLRMFLTVRLPVSAMRRQL